MFRADKKPPQGGWRIKSKPGITRLIEMHRAGDEDAFDRVVSLLYADLRRLAHRQLANFHGNATLQTTAVVNEAYLKLKNSDGNAVSRDHFLGIAAKAMRHVVIDYARGRMAEKRGGAMVRVELQEKDLTVAAQAEQLILINDALEELGSVSERMVRVFECKFFAELSDEETAAALDQSVRTVQRDWMKARGLLAESLILDAENVAVGGK